MGDGYFYTLSAIAQSFAAIIALYAIFVIYSLQSAKNRRDILLRDLREWMRRDMVKNKHFLQEIALDELSRTTDEDVVAQARTCKGGRIEIVQSVKRIVDRIDENEMFSKRIIGWLKITLFMNGAVIVSSLVLLPWGSKLPQVLHYILVPLVFLLCFLALLITVHAILIAIGSPGVSLIARHFRKCIKP